MTFARMTAWLSARFGRAHREGLNRIPPMTGLSSEDDFFAELVDLAPDEAVTLIGHAADFLRIKRTARAPDVQFDMGTLRRLSHAIGDLTDCTLAAAWPNR